VLVLSIGVSLGGPTGYAINPAPTSDRAWRTACCPSPAKGDSDWSYAWVPVVGPVVGGILGALFYRAAWLL